MYYVIYVACQCKKIIFKGTNMIPPPETLKPTDTETQKYVLNHTMLRIRDPQLSLDFYTRILGMKLIRQLDFSKWRFTLYFLAYIPDNFIIPTDDHANAQYVFGRESVLDLS